MILCEGDCFIGKFLETADVSRYFPCIDLSPDGFTQELLKKKSNSGDLNEARNYDSVNSVHQFPYLKQIDGSVANVRGRRVPYYQKVVEQARKTFLFQTECLLFVFLLQNMYN